VAEVTAVAVTKPVSLLARSPDRSTGA
jgi:hypothetical protein